MRKILHVVSDMNFGGVGRYISLLDNHIIDVNESFYLIMPRGSVLKNTIKNMEIIEVDGLADKSFSMEGRRSIEDEVKKLKPDIIHTHGCLAARLVGKRLNIPTVFTKHTLSSESRGLKKLISTSIHSYLSSKAIAVSMGAYDNLKHFGFKDKDISLIYNGVASQDNQEDKTIRNRILMVGRLEEIKGPRECLKIAALLKDMISEDFEILLAGDGSLMDSLKEEAENEKLPIRFLGHIDDIDSLYETAHIVINTSESEALPYSIIEGMSYKKPIVAFDINGIREVVLDKETGFIVPYLDHGSFADKIKLLLTDSELKASMGEKCKARVDEMFSVDQMINKLMKVYEVMYEDN